MEEPGELANRTQALKTRTPKPTGTGDPSTTTATMKNKLTFPQIRQMFWDQRPEYKAHYRKTWKQNQYNTTIRSDWCMFIDYLMKDDQITEHQAQNITL